MRVAVGLVFLAIGIAKFVRPLAPGLPIGIEGFELLLVEVGVPFAGLQAWAITLLEIGGGLALVLNLFTPIAATLLAAEMAVAFVTVGLPAILGQPVLVQGIVIGAEAWRQPLELGLLVAAGFIAWNTKERLRPMRPQNS